MKIRHRVLLGLASAILSTAAASAATITVNKSPYCGCCQKWVEIMRQQGFAVKIVETEALAPVARRLGVPDKLRSCHTAEAGGYFIEGHVPGADIGRLFKEKPKAAGLAVPGMPLGSPGMDSGGARKPYATMIVDRSGKARLFANHG